MDPIRLKIDSDRMDEAMRGLISAGRDASPLMRAIAGDMHAAVETNFRLEGRPPWAGLAPSTQAARAAKGFWPGKILQRTGPLAAAISEDYDATSAVVGTKLAYAAAHQLGARTKAHRIAPRHKKALAFGGRVVKSVMHPGSDIPARPFLFLDDSDEDKIVGRVTAYLQGLI
jgi:phage virion morphogenesis protein